jgi:hypothetical protein
MSNRQKPYECWNVNNLREIHVEMTDCDQWMASDKNII